MTKNQINTSSLLTESEGGNNFAFVDSRSGFNLDVTAGLRSPLLIYIIVCGLVISALLGNAEGQNTLIPALAIAALVGLLIFAVNRRHTKRKAKFAAAHRQFVTDNHFTEGLALDLTESSKPFIYGLGDRQAIYNSFGGALGQTNFDVFCYAYYKKTKNSEQSHPFTVLHFKLNKPLPHIVLDSRKNDGIISSIPRYFSDKQRIELEGDFGKYFDLFGPLEYETETLDILSPDFMQMLIDFHSDFDIEIDDRDVYIISKGFNYDQQSMNELFKAASVMVDKFNDKIKVWSMTASTKQPPQLESFSGESSIRLGSKRITSAAIIIPLIAVGLTIRIWDIFGGSLLIYLSVLAAVMSLMYLSRNKHSS